MFYLVAFPRYDKELLVIMHKSDKHDEVMSKLKERKIGDVYTNYAILSDIYPLLGEFAVSQQGYDARKETL